MITLDGGRGGGSILRVGLGLAIALQKPLRVIDIRRDRPNAGLQAQHLAGLRAAARLCQAHLDGDQIGSREIEFHPGPIQTTALQIQIETAGSVALTLQPIQIALAGASQPLDLEIEGGGTYGQWAPPVSYLEHVNFALLARRGFKAHIEIEREGFYPKGGARVRARFEPCQLKGPLDFSERGQLEAIQGLSIASEHLRKSRVAERQAEAAQTLLQNEFLQASIKIEARYANTLSPGSAVVLWAICEDTILGGDALGERGLSAEKVGTRAASALISEWRSDATLDQHMADQIIPFLVLHGGRFFCTQLTDHLRTNIWVAEQITGAPFKIVERTGTWEMCCDANTIRSQRGG